MEGELHKPWAIRAAAALASISVSLVVVATAQAGTYRVAQCYPEFGAFAEEASVFDTTNDDHYRETRDCRAENGFAGLRVTTDGQPVAGRREGGWLFTAPAGTVITHIRSDGSGVREHSQEPEMTAVAPNGVNEQFGAEEGIEKPHFWAGGRFPQATSYKLGIQCQRAEGELCGGTTNPVLVVRRTVLTLVDSSAPQVTEVAGGLVAPATVRGPQGVTIGGSDVGSGLAAALVVVNGTAAAGAGFACERGTHEGETLAVKLTPCPAGDRRTLTVDTAAPPFQQGLNGVQLCLSDLATDGAPGTTCAARDVRVDNACPVSTPAGAADLQIDFGPGDRLAHTARFGSKVEVSGRAVDASGAPVPNAEVCLAQRTLSSPYAPEQVVDTARSGGKGGFKLRVPAGPNRELRIGHWQPSGVPVDRFATLKVHAKPRFRVASKGELSEGEGVRFRASLNPPFADGRKVRVEAKAKAGWVGVPGCKGRSDDRRKFGCRWRVPEQGGTDDYALRFRAFVPGQDGYPYLAGASATEKVRVKG